MDIPECVTHTRRSAPEAAAPQWPTHRCNSRSRHRERSWLGQKSGSSQANELSQRIRETDFSQLRRPALRLDRADVGRSGRAEHLAWCEGLAPWRCANTRPTDDQRTTSSPDREVQPDLPATRHPRMRRPPAPYRERARAGRMERYAKGRVTFESAETFVGWLSTHWPRGWSGLATSNAPQAGTSRTCDSCRAQPRPYASAPTARSPRLRRSAAHSASVATSTAASFATTEMERMPPAGPVGASASERVRGRRRQRCAPEVGEGRGKQLPKEPGTPGHVNEVRRRLK